MAEFVLNAEVRSRTGKGDARRLREQGKVPAVMYGKGLEPLHLVLDSREVEKVMATSHKNTLFRLTFNGGAQPERKVLVRDRQLDPITQIFRHVDFQALDDKIPVRVAIPIHFVGEPVGKKLGALFQIQMRTVDVECLPPDIPVHFEADITELGVGDSLHVAVLKTNPRVKILASAEAVLCNTSIVKEEVVVAPVAAAAEGEAAAPAEGAEAAEGGEKPAAGAPAAAGAAPAKDKKEDKKA